MLPSFEQLELFEEWLPVVGYEGLYEVSNWGRIRSLARKTTAGRILVQRRNRYGYFAVDLSKDNHQETRLIHRLVAAAFLGPSTLGVDHIDGNRANNVLANLRYATQKENISSARERRDWKGNAKLTPQKVLEARRLRMEGMTHKAIAEVLGVARSTIGLLLSKQSWRELSGD